LISVPLVYASIRTLRKHYADPISLAPANLNMIRAHSIVSFGLIGGYAVQGLTHGANVIQLTFAISLLFLVYLPVALILVKKPRQ
jgi:hypothetical protein